MRVLLFLRLLERRLHRRFNANEYVAETRAPHHLQQVVVVCKIHARLRRERERVAMSFGPVDQIWEQTFDVALVTDKVIINDEDYPVPTGSEECVQLSDHLLVTLGARNATVNLNDVAELAVEGAAARILQRHKAILL